MAAMNERPNVSIKKISMRFCSRNVKDEGASEVVSRQSEHNSDLLNIETLHCLGNCSLCNQGPYCALNDILFQEKDAAALNKRIDQLLGKLRKALDEKLADRAKTDKTKLDEKKK